MYAITTLAISITCLLRLSGGQTIDPSSVSDETKTKWCNDQQAACPLLCRQQGASDVPTANDCTASSLVYSCICSDGQQPNASEYSQTIPFYECQEAGNQCVARCPKSDSACQTTCRTANPCGAQNPTRVNTSTVSTMSATRTGGGAAASATDADATAAYTGFGAASTTGSGGDSSDARALVIGVGKSYGLAIIFIGISAGFTFLL